MIHHLPRAVLPILLGSCALVSISQGQIEVTAQMGKSEYVANEAVGVTVTITNRAGRDVFLHGDSRNSWLDFIIKNEQGVPLTPFQGNPGFQAVNVPAGRSVSRLVNLSDTFRVSDLGRYAGYATVRMAGDKETIYTSNRIHFNVTRGRTIYSQKIGVPGSDSTREYRVVTFNSQQKSQLFVEVEDGRTGRVLRTFSLGDSLMFRKPEATVDGANNLNVLFLNSPSVFVHASISPEGQLLSKQLFKRGATGEPRLITFANGEVKTGGGVPYDPNAVQVQRNKVRRLSERPPFTYQ